MFEHKNAQSVEVLAIPKFRTHVIFPWLMGKEPHCKPFNIIHRVSIYFVVNGVLIIHDIKLVFDLERVGFDWLLQEKTTKSILYFWQQFDSIFQSDGGTQFFPL